MIESLHLAWPLTVGAIGFSTLCLAAALAAAIGFAKSTPTRYRRH